MRVVCSPVNEAEADATLAILESVDGLQSMYFTSIWRPARAFEAVVKANPGLVDVSIQFIGLGEGELSGSLVKVLTDLVTLLGKFCPSLASIEVEERRQRKGNRFDVVANACVPLRNRGVSVSV